METDAAKLQLQIHNGQGENKQFVQKLHSLIIDMCNIHIIIFLTTNV